MEHKETIVDSSVWIAYFYESDTQHEKARKIVNNLVAPLIPEYVLLEVTTILRLKKQEEALKRFVDLTITGGAYLPVGNLGLEIASCFSDIKYRKLSFVDVGLALLSKKYKVVTFNKELEKVIN